MRLTWRLVSSPGLRFEGAPLLQGGFRGSRARLRLAIVVNEMCPKRLLRGLCRLKMKVLVQGSAGNKHLSRCAATSALRKKAGVQPAFLLACISARLLLLIFESQAKPLGGRRHGAGFASLPGK